MYAVEMCGERVEGRYQESPLGSVASALSVARSRAEKRQIRPTTGRAGGVGKRKGVFYGGGVSRSWQSGVIGFEARLDVVHLRLEGESCLLLHGPHPLAHVRPPVRGPDMRATTHVIQLRQPLRQPEEFLKRGMYMEGDELEVDVDYQQAGSIPKTRSYEL